MTQNIEKNNGQSGMEELVIKNNEERFYHDGPSSCTSPSTKKKADIADQTSNDSLKITDWLFKRSHQDPELRAIAIKLAQCQEYQRCASGACLRCMRATSRALIGAAENWGEKVGYEYIVMGLRLSDLCFSLSEMEKLQFDAITKKVKVILEKCGFTFVVVGIDLHVCESREGLFEPYVIVRPNAVVYKHEYRRHWTALREKLKSNNSKLIARPAKAQYYNDGHNAITDCFKYRFCRRVSFYSKKKCRQDTKMRPLRVGQKMRLMKLLNKEGLGSRLTVVGVARGIMSCGSSN